MLALNTRGYKIKTDKGYVWFEGVAKMGPKQVYELIFDDGSSVTTTSTHCFFSSDGREIMVGECEIGVTLMGTTDRTVVKIIDAGIQDTYDIIGSDTSTFLANGVLSHNCEFISSDPLLIDTLALQRLTSSTQGKKPVADFNQIKLYEHPKPGATYLIGVDPATGSGEDFSTIQAFRFPEMIQAAEFRSNTLSAAQLHFVLKKLLRMYDRVGGTQVFYTVENNGVGDSLITLIENDEDPIETAEFVSEDGASRRGVATTGKSKIRSCIALKDLLEKDHMQLNSPLLVHELKTFVRSKGSYAAQRGATDDLVMAVVIVMRLLEEIASFDEIAYDRLYVSSLRDLEEADKESGDDDYNPADYISFG